MRVSTGVITGLTALMTGLVVSSTQAFAQNTVKLSIAAGYAKGNNEFSVVVKDTPGTKLELYVNDKNPTKATVNKQDWATFNGVILTGTGKLSFSRLVNGKQQPISYTRKYTVNNGKVSFSSFTTTASVTRTTAMPFTTSTIQDSSLAKGSTQVKTQGVNGTETSVYKVTYTNGKQTSKTPISQSVTTAPINEVVEDGTYVAPAPVSTPAPQASTAPSTTSCHPLSDEGTCYEPGEYCRDSDEGTSGVAGDGESITCEDNDGLRWEPN